MYGSFGSDRDLSLVPTYLEWWYDEYSVTPYPYGRADTTGRYVGWLGEPARPAYQTIEGAWRRDFSKGIVLVNPADTVVVVDLMRPYWKRISGIRDRAVNNGHMDRFQRIRPHDAVFLLSSPRPTARELSR